MGKVKNSFSISLEFTPWTDEEHFRVVKLHMVEELGGRIPEGEMTLHYDGDDSAAEFLTKQLTGTIKLQDEKKGGLQYEIPIFIKSRNVYKNIVDLKFICTKDITFYTKPISETYKSGIRETIQCALTDNSDFRTEPDSNVDGQREYQRAETGYEFCKRLAYAYKKDTVFCFGWEGFMIKDICGEKNSFGKTDGDLVLIGGTTMIPVSSTTLKHDENLNSDGYDPWEGRDGSGSEVYPTTIKAYDDTYKSWNATVSMNRGADEYQICSKEAYSKLDNARYNNKFMTSGFYSRIKLKGIDFPSYKIGDVVNYRMASQGSSYPYQRFLISGNEVFWTDTDSDGETDDMGMKLSWTMILLGLDAGDWTVSVNEGEADSGGE